MCVQAHASICVHAFENSCKRVRMCAMCFSVPVHVCMHVYTCMRVCVCMHVYTNV